MGDKNTSACKTKRPRVRNSDQHYDRGCREAKILSHDLSLNGSRPSRQPSLAPRSKFLSPKNDVKAKQNYSGSLRSAISSRANRLPIDARHRRKSTHDAHVTQNHRFARHGTFFQRCRPPHRHHWHVPRHRPGRGHTAHQGRPHGLPREPEWRARSAEAAQAAGGGIPMVCDLASLDSVRQFADELSGKELDVLCLNAGIAPSTKAEAPETTADGFESCIGTNHLGHFLLANLLAPKVKRMVVTASSVHDPEQPGGAVGGKGGATLGDLSGLGPLTTGGPTMVDGATTYDGSTAARKSDSRRPPIDSRVYFYAGPRSTRTRSSATFCSAARRRSACQM